MNLVSVPTTVINTGKFTSPFDQSPLLFAAVPDMHIQGKLNVL